ncbi:hypothetical protein [Kitasatospora sp. KL5]|uniref:PASTA domain-containing protein n=1 Tax=Kitasatospora sp. KL5 TaxID=3425125 RepID=UPI003D6F0F12
MSQPHLNKTPQSGPQWGTPPPPQQSPSFIDWVKAHKGISGIGAGLAVITVGAALASGAGQPPAAPTAPNTPAAAAAPPQSAPAAVPAATAPAAAGATAGQSKQAELPDFVGMGLQSAQDKAQAAGFYVLASHDALGRSRSRIDDRNSKVCTQTPTAGQQKAVAKITDDAEELPAFCDFPAGHWTHLRTTNPIESTFSGFENVVLVEREETAAA